jgi:hypothetical protein
MSAAYYDIQAEQGATFRLYLTVANESGQALNLLGSNGFVPIEELPKGFEQRFIDTGIIIKNKRLSYIEIKVTKSEIDIIYIACKLYWKILVSDFSFIETVLLHKCDKEEIRKILLEISDLSHDIQNKYIHRKSKWAYDVCKAIENIDGSDIIKNIGTLPKLKIIKNG